MKSDRFCVVCGREFSMPGCHQWVIETVSRKGWCVECYQEYVRVLTQVDARRRVEGGFTG